jgi:DNA-binding LacI/PurR family transcriptional regulator
MARARDVAARAGVSTATVSHVLNGTRRVDAVTRERVLAAVRALDYRPNMLARGLRAKSTRTIGLLVSKLELPYYTEIAAAVEAAAWQRNFSVVLCNSDENLEKEILYTDVLLGKQVDGLIIAPVRGDHSFLRPHLDRGVRIVLVNRYLADVPVPAVVCDDEDGTYRLTARLLQDGHRRLGAVLGLSGVSTTEQRLAGFKRALDQHGVACDDAWLFSSDARRDGGIAAGRALAEMADPPTAVVAFNTLLVDGVLLGLLERAPHLIPRIEVTGFGNSPVARICRAARYTLDAPTRELGTVAATMLVDAIETNRPLAPDRVLLRSEIVEFGTSAPDWRDRVVPPVNGRRGEVAAG